MQTFTLDTSCVIHAAQQQAEAGAVERLVDAARKSRVTLWLTAAFAADQTRASSEHLRANLEWLAEPDPSIKPYPDRFAWTTRNSTARMS